MSGALSTVWIDDVKPEMGDICWRDNIFFVDATASASSVGCEGKLIAYHHDDKVQALVNALKAVQNRMDILGGFDNRFTLRKKVDAALAPFNPTRKETP